MFRSRCSLKPVRLYARGTWEIARACVVTRRGLAPAQSWAKTSEIQLSHPCIYYPLISIMLCRSSHKLLKIAKKYSTFAQTTATLRLSPDRSKQVECDVDGAPYYSVMFDKQVGCDLAGRDLGREPSKVDLIFYGGRHFAQSIASHLTIYNVLTFIEICFHNLLA